MADEANLDVSQPVKLSIAGVMLDADLVRPADASGVVLFAHGSGSSRHSSRNQQVARGLQREGYATLLMDLLTEHEESIDLRTRELRFNIPLLAGRLTSALDWLSESEQTSGLPLAIFGASTGAAAALVSAADRPELVHLVISRGGRPDLAGDALGRVQAPILLIVGGRDPEVYRLNQQAATELRSAELVVVPGATHLFEERGALDTVLRLAVDALHRWL
jgi:putative phosphoribosyl transferase